MSEKDHIKIKVNSGDDAAVEQDIQEPEVLDPEEPVAVAEETVDFEDRFMRLAAEFENYKKRSEREKAEFLKRANESLLAELLPVLDNLERAVEASDGSDAQTMQKGVEMVLDQLRKGLAKFGLEEIEALGKPFDPQLHEAMMQQEDPDAEAGTVLSQYQKGYRFRDRLLRPAMVVVAKEPETDSA